MKKSVFIFICTAIVIGTLPLVLDMSQHISADLNNHIETYDHIRELDIDDFREKYASAFIDYKYEGPIIIRSLKKSVCDNCPYHIYYNDSLLYRYYKISLVDKQGDEYQVILWDALEGTLRDYGYISKETPIRIFSRAYSDNSLRIYEQPDSLSKSIIDPVPYRNEQLDVVDFSGLWLKVIMPVEPNGGNVEGWISKSQQCDEIFTTCS